jgi:hypothetical protein
MDAGAEPASTEVRGILGEYLGFALPGAAFFKPSGSAGSLGSDLIEKLLR